MAWLPSAPGRQEAWLPSAPGRQVASLPSAGAARRVHPPLPPYPLTQPASWLSTGCSTPLPTPSSPSSTASACSGTSWVRPAACRLLPNGGHTSWVRPAASCRLPPKGGHTSWAPAGHLWTPGLRSVGVRSDAPPCALAATHPGAPPAPGAGTICFVIALPIVAPTHQSAKFVFTQFNNPGAVRRPRWLPLPCFPHALPSHPLPLSPSLLLDRARHLLPAPPGSLVCPASLPTPQASASPTISTSGSSAC